MTTPLTVRFSWTAADETEYEVEVVADFSPGSRGGFLEPDDPPDWTTRSMRRTDGGPLPEDEQERIEDSQALTDALYEAYNAATYPE